jgi:uncharacterized RDD family membrane protein YckC
MVIEDISNSINESHSKKFQIPSPSDRFLSFAFDFVVVSPVSGLLAVGFLKDLKSLFLHSTQDLEILKSILQWGFVYFSSYFLILSVFILFYNATPGQMVFSLRVRHQQNSRLSLLQCWIRAAGPWLSLTLFGAPLLEMFSHPRRRTFYDRWSDTEVYTLKEKGEGSPSDFEARFIKQWTSTSFVVIYLLVFVQVFNLSRTMQTTAYQPTDYGQSCEAMNSFKNTQLSSLDRAMTLWLLDKDYGPCLRKVLDSENTYRSYPQQAYFAAALMTEDLNLKDLYTQEICGLVASQKNLGLNISKPQNCSLLKQKAISVTELSDLPSQIIWLQNQQKQKQKNAEFFLALDQILDEPLLMSHFMKDYVASYLSSSQQQSELRTQRAPAAVSDKMKEAQARFLKRMGSSK